MRQNSTHWIFKFLLLLSSAYNPVLTVWHSPPSVLPSRSWRTGLERCPSTRSSGSLCRLSWTSCITAWVDSTGPKTPLLPLAVARSWRMTRWRPPQTSRPWTPGTHSWVAEPLNLLLDKSWERRNWITWGLIEEYFGQTLHSLTSQSK